MNDRQIAAIQPTSKRQEIAMPDSKSLYLIVTTAGGKSFQFKPRVGGKLVRKKIGEYPAMSLREAKAKVMSLRGKLEIARASSTPPVFMQLTKPAAKSVTFGEAFRFYMEAEGR